MASDVSVSFGGDTSGLNAAVDRAQAAVKGFSVGVASSMGPATKAIRAVQYASELAAAAMLLQKATATDTGGALNTFSTASGKAAEGLGVVARYSDQAQVALARLGIAAEGAFSQSFDNAANSLTGFFTSAAYAQRGAAMFTVANEGMVAAIGRSIIANQELGANLARPFTDALLALRLWAAGVNETALASVAAAGNVQQLTATLNSSGIKESAQLFSPLIYQLEHIPDTSNDAAVAIVAMLTSIPNYTPKSLDVLVQLLQTMAKTGDEAKAMAKTIADAFKDGENGGATLGGIAAQIKNMEALRTVTQEWARSLAPDQAVAMFDTITKKLGDQSALLKRQVTDEQAKIAREAEEGDYLGTIYHQLTSQSDAHERILRSLGQTVDLLKVARAEQAALAEGVQKEKAFRDALDAAKTSKAQLADKQTEATTLGGRSRRDVDTDEISAADKQLAIFTAALEAGDQGVDGMIAVLNTMKNRMAADYGNYGDSLGDVIKKRRAYSAVDDGSSGEFDPSKAEAFGKAAEAHAGAARAALARAREAYEKVFGEDAAEDPTKGATHYYNPALASPAWGAGMQNKTTKGDHVFGNPDGPPVLSEDDAGKAKERIAEINTEMRKLNDTIEGGSAEEKAQLATAQANLTSAKDAVAEAQKLVDVRKAAVTATKDGTPEEQFKAEQQLVQAQQTLKDQQLARDQARNALSTAQVQEGSRAQLDATLAGLNQRQAGYAKDSASFLDIEREKLEATRRFNAQEAANAAEAENEKFDVAQRGFANQRRLIEENMRNAVLPTMAGNEAILASYVDQEKAAQNHYAKLGEIERQYGTDSVAAVRTLARQSAAEQTKLLAEQVQATQKAGADMQASFKQHFEQAGSSVSSSLMAMLEGTGNFRNLMQNLAKDVAGQFVSAGVRMVADWTAHQAAMVAQAILGQNLQTTAVATGEAARGAAVAAGAATQSATVGASLLKTLGADAAAAEGGVIAFLAPIMGPLAAGPGAAIGALVAGLGSLASFDTGTMNVPSDMVAKIHKGEIIIPAALSGVIRSMMGPSSTMGGLVAGPTPEGIVSSRAMPFRGFTAA